MDVRPGTAEFAAAIDGARGIVDIDALRVRLDLSASEFCRKADVSESWYSNRKRKAAPLRPRSLRNLKDTLRRLSGDRAAASFAAQPGVGQ